jgi:hypothetical protein
LHAHWRWLSLAVLVAVPWYTFAAMRTVYGGRRLRRIGRGIVVAVLYGITLGAVLFGVAIWSMVS